MQEVEKKLGELETALASAWERLRLDEATKQTDELQTASEARNFWTNSTKAQETMKRLASLQTRLEPWQKLRNELKDVRELIDLKDASLIDDISQNIETAQATFDQLKADLKFTGPYDDHDVIMSIFAGAGGTDAQDWAQMLLRMYVRWAESHGYKTLTIEQSAGDEAGLKSVTLEIDGAFAYGKLKGEHGVHRLVRLSPFNADNLRQTSFAKVDILPKVEQSDSLNIDEKDLKIDVYRAGGHGGQSVNTTDSAVRVTHLPTGITVAIQNERSQLQNKETAMTILRSRLAALQLEQHKEHVAELKGPNQSAEWGNQIRSYVLHPYKQVKDLRTRHETSDPDAVLDGNLDPFIDSYLEYGLKA